MKKSKSKSSRESENKDEKVRIPKKVWKQSSPNKNVDGAHPEFKPWDDKPDACLAQQDKVGSRKNMTISKVN